ncbi:hypothetical protein, partial [Rhodohalobacter sulfatireducens]
LHESPRCQDLRTLTGGLRKKFIAGTKNNMSFGANEAAAGYWGFLNPTKYSRHGIFIATPKFDNQRISVTDQSSPPARKIPCLS